MKQRLILIGLAVVALIALYVVANTSRLSISVSGIPAGTMITYSLTDQHTNKTQLFQDSSGSISKIVARSSYEVVVKTDTTSYLQVIRTGWFMGNTDVAATPHSEFGRQFVGDNPDYCMDYLQSVLYSHGCNSTSGPIKVHIPASPDQPTYVETQYGANGYIESSAKIKEGNVVLLAIPANSEQPIGQVHVEHTLATYNLNGTAIVPTSQVALSSLDPSKSYSLEPYLSGFIAYDASFSQVWYYSSIHAKPSQITIEGPKTKGLEAAALTAAANGDIAMTYLNIVPRDDSGAAGNKGVSEIVLYSNGASQHFVLNKEYSLARYCGSSWLCLLNSQSKTAEVRDITTKDLAVVFRLTGVTSLIEQNGAMLAVRADGLWSIDPNTQTGFMGYSFGKYQSCGVQTGGGGYLVCVSNGGVKSALYLDPASANTDSIDKKIGTLRDLPEVATVSVYGKTLFIVPRGPSSYDPSTRSFGPNPDIQAGITSQINKALNSLGIDRKIYSVTITAP